MTDNVKPFQLVPRDTAVLSQDVIEVLEDVLADAKAGNVESVLVIVRRPDGSWNSLRTGVIDYPAAIGRLEIFKQEWIEEYLTDRENMVAEPDERA